MEHISVKMTKNLTYGIIAILMIGLTGTGYILLTPEQLNAARTCTTNNITGIFEKYSSTNVTAYWTENGTSKQLVCTKGKWIPTREWMKIHNLTEAQMTGLPLPNSDIDEEGNLIIKDKTIIVDKSGKVSINGEIYNITHVPIIRCICEKTTGCQLKECAG